MDAEDDLCPAPTLVVPVVPSRTPHLPSPVVVWPSVVLATGPPWLGRLGPPVDVVLAALQLSQLANDAASTGSG